MYIFEKKLPTLSYEKLKLEILDGAKIILLTKDKKFIETMNHDEKEGWMAFSQ